MHTNRAHNYAATATYIFVLMYIKACHGEGKVRGKQIFSRSEKSQGILYQVREILNSTSKSLNSHEILFFACRQVWERVSLLAKVTLFQKNIYKGTDFLASMLSLLAKNLSSMVLENLFADSAKSGNFYYRDKWQPCWIHYTKTKPKLHMTWERLRGLLKIVQDP